MKLILFLLVVLQLTKIRGHTDEVDDYKAAYEEQNKQFKDQLEKLNIAELRLLTATKKIAALETELKQDKTNCPKDIGINSKCETVAYFGAVLEACKDMDRELKAMNEHLNQLAGARKNVYRNASGEEKGRLTVDRMPESCDDLRKIGHTMNGFYDVKGSKTIRSVYCNFTKLPGDPGMETAIGVVDVKSSPVYFHVQRDQMYTSVGTTIPFQVVRLNVGGGMNITSGIFTAPVSGIYHFSLTAIKNRPAAYLTVDLYLNSTYITRAEGTKVYDTITAALSVTLSLKSGDRISLRLTEGELFDDFFFHTNFNGLLLQEEMLS